MTTDASPASVPDSTGTDAEPDAPRALRYAPHAAVASAGYTVFGYAGVPALYLDRFAIGFTAFGLLMSATLLPFVLVQVPAGRLVGRYTTTRLLLWTTAAHAALALLLDVAPTYESLLGLRFVWGCAAGLLLSVGATHVARLYAGGAATQHQGVYGGMLTLGGAVGFLAAPRFAALANGVGIQAGGALLAVPALVALWRHRDERATAPETTAPPSGPSTGGPSVGSADESALSTVTDRTVLLASLFYVAIIGSYMTLSTFVTAYFEELGVVGPLNALVLVTASAGRALGGAAVHRLPGGDAGLVGGATALAVLGFVGLSAGLTGAVLVALPLVVMLAVSVPFGAVYNVAATATDREGVALATVIAVGNVAALTLPAVTGAVRDATGGYRGAFVLLGLLNALALGGAVVLSLGERDPDRDETDRDPDQCETDRGPADRASDREADHRDPEPEEHV
jgi:predicted MFS family arabinose efflux permease